MAYRVYAVFAGRALIAAGAALLVLLMNFIIYYGAAPGKNKAQGAVCLALDCSVSMAGEKLAAAKEGLWKAVDRIPEGASMTLVAFRRKAETIVSDTTQKGEIIAAAEGLHGAGETGISEGLKEAIASIRDLPGVRRILLFTDGQNGEERLRSGIREQLLKEKMILIVVGMSKMENEELRALAEESGGAYITAAEKVDFSGTEGADRWKRRMRIFTAFEIAGAEFMLLALFRRQDKKQQGRTPLPNAGYLKKEEIRKML